MSSINILGQAINTLDIVLDYPSTMLKVKKLRNIAADLEDVNKTLNKQLQKMDGAWKGTAADAMREKISQAQATNRTLTEQLNQVAREIETISTNIYNEDMASIHRIQNMDK